MTRCIHGKFELFLFVVRVCRVLEKSNNSESGQAKQKKRNGKMNKVREYALIAQLLTKYI